jgi:hypothetical protein
MAKPRKKIAVILFGQPRFVKNKIASKSLKWWLRGADIDYYGHCWFDEKTKLYDTAPWANLGKISLNAKSTSMILQQYPRINLIINKPEVFDIEYYKSLLNIDINETISEVLKREIGNLENSASQFLSIHLAISNFRKNSGSKTYDLVILTRYDNLMWKMQRPIYYPQKKLTLSNHHSGFPDLLFAGSFELINALDVWPDFERLIKNERNLSAEYLKRKSFFEKFSSDDLNPIYSDISIIRGNDLKYLYVNLPFMRLRRILKIKTRINFLLSMIKKERPNS